MPAVVHPKHKETLAAQNWHDMNDTNFYDDPMNEMEVTVYAYKNLIDHNDVPNHEARQILPNASAVNILWTVNARALYNFFRQRCCNRNTAEMHLFANRLHQYVDELWPEYGRMCGPQCTYEKCQQGAMACEQGEWAYYVTL